MLILITSPAFAGDSKVYSDGDLEKYKTGHEEKSWQYNEKVLQDTQRESDYYNTQSKVREALDKYQRIIEENKIKQDAALEKIHRLEQEKAQDKIDAGKGEFIGGYVGKRNREQRKEREIAREAELDKLYREAGLSRERDLQKRTEEAEKKAEKAERKARFTEMEAQRKAQDAKFQEERYFDTKSHKWINCSGGICY